MFAAPAVNQSAAPVVVVVVVVDRLGLRRTYVFSYNLLQFCGHTWILANTVARFLTFGRGETERLRRKSIRVVFVFLCLNVFVIVL